MSAQFITIQKVVQTESRPIELKPEIIRLDEIKSIRPWVKNKDEEREIKEDFLLIYMHNDKGKETRVKIAESFDHFEKRTNAIKNLNQKKDAEQHNHPTEA